MSSRKPGYLIGVILLALVLSAPQFLFTLIMGVEAYQYGSWPLPSIPGIGGSVFYGTDLSSATFWRDQFLSVDYRPRTDGGLDLTVSAIDAESGATIDLGLLQSSSGFYHTLIFGDRLWLVGKVDAFEFVDGAFQPALFAVPPRMMDSEQQFLLNGEAACVNGMASRGFCVSTFTGEKWGNTRDVVLPTHFRDVAFHFDRGAHVTCRNQGDRVHVFLHTGRRLFHREGLELEPVSAVEDLFGARTVPGTKKTDEPVSALRTANFDGATAGWTLVREKPNVNQRTVYSHENLFGMLVGGQPAAMILEDHDDGNPVGRLYRFDGTNWSEFATQAFPFGTNEVSVASCRDGQKSYIVASTSTGAAHCYAVEATGIRATSGASLQSNPALADLKIYAIVPAVVLVLAILLGLGTWFMMWCYTKPDYEFGVQTVKLASLGRRGLARLTDLALIVLSTTGLGWAMTRGFDWLSWLEALNLKVDHPTIPVVARVVSILELWLVLVVVTLLFTQGRCGLTPGKWLCGLRTLRTTLRPCGFARSLVREVVLSVDVCNFLCWTPGLLSIAFTNCRQRLGDLVADTIVIEAASRPDN